MPEFLQKKDGKESDYSRQCEMLARSFAQKYISIAELDFSTGLACVIKSDMDKEIEGIYIPWEEIVDRYISRRVYPDDSAIVRSLTLEYMKAALEEKGFPIELRCRSGQEEYNWIQIDVSPVGDNLNKLLITTCNINEERMIRSVVDLFVFKNYDYLILVDAKHNTYTRLSGNKRGIPLPAQYGSDYMAEVQQFNEKYLVQEDLDLVNNHMRISYVTKILEYQESYEFSAGMLNDNGIYQRIRIKFTYYDKSAGLILVSRRNVSQIYFEEQLKNAQLSAAMQAAQIDTLTGIYNQKATSDLIRQSLDGQYHNMAAILFIDVDNFKMVNDTMGHQSGDKLLCFLAGFLKKIAGKDGIAGRVGGDEFLLYLPSIKDIGIVTEFAQKICNPFYDAREQQLDISSVTCSVGIAVYPRDGVDYETLVNKADQALYTSKRYGKDKYLFYFEEFKHNNSAVDAF